MTNVRRYYRPGQIIFLTHVTLNRVPILIDHADLLWDAANKLNTESKFDLIAHVILPDHFHVIIDPGDNNLSTLMKKLKLSFSTRYRKRVGLIKGRVWQYRYWDHVIRDENDLRRHVDYIHYNPVKHGIATDPSSWEHSSIHQFLQRGLYMQDWGVKKQIEFEGEFGE